LLERDAALLLLESLMQEALDEDSVLAVV